MPHTMRRRGQPSAMPDPAAHPAFAAHPPGHRDVDISAAIQAAMAQLHVGEESGPFTQYESDGSDESDFVYDDDGRAVRTVIQRHKPYLLTHPQSMLNAAARSFRNEQHYDQNHQPYQHHHDAQPYGGGDSAPADEQEQVAFGDQPAVEFTTHIVSGPYGGHHQYHHHDAGPHASIPPQQPQTYLASYADLHATRRLRRVDSVIGQNPYYPPPAASAAATNGDHLHPPRARSQATPPTAGTYVVSHPHHIYATTATAGGFAPHGAGAPNVNHEPPSQGHAGVTAGLRFRGGELDATTEVVCRRGLSAEPDQGHHHHPTFGADPAGDEELTNRETRTNSEFHRTVSQLSDAATITNTSLAAMPAHLHDLGKEIKRLSTLELLHVAGLVSRKAHKEVFSIVQYTGGNWYLPKIRRCHPDEPDWAADYSLGTGLVLHIAGQRLEVHVVGYLLRIAILFLLYFVLWTILPLGLVERGGVVFDPVVTVVFATVLGGFICRLLQIPPLVGILWAGILWNNAPQVGYYTAGIHKEVRTIAGRLGITVLLLRAGFSTSWKSVRPILPNASMLSIFAMVLEGIVHSIIAEYIFEYDSFTWAFLHGFVCSVISGAVVVPAVLLLQGDGYGKDQGPLPLMLSSVGVETVLGVWICNFIVGLLFSDASLGFSIGMGPVQIIGGTVIAIFMAYLFHGMVELLKTEAARMPNGELEPSHLERIMHLSLLVFISMAFGAVFLGYRYNLAGGGCVIAMVFALATAHLWLKDEDPELMEQKKILGHGLCSSWDLAVMPFLFSMTGSKIKLSAMFNSTFFPKALACFLTSNAVRMAFVCVSSYGLEFTWRERALHALGWMAKATVQSAMSGVALENVNTAISALPPLSANSTATEVAQATAKRASLLRDQERATTILNTAIFYVMFGAPIAAVALTKWGPRVLSKEVLITQ